MCLSVRGVSEVKWAAQQELLGEDMNRQAARKFRGRQRSRLVVTVRERRRPGFQPMSCATSASMRTYAAFSLFFDLNSLMIAPFHLKGPVPILS
jgi:hypothetical protein